FGRVLSKSLTILTGNFAKYFLFGAIIALPNLAATFADGRVARVGQHHQQIFNATDVGVGLLFGLTWIVVFAVCQSSLIYGAFQDVRGRPFDIGASVQRGLSRFLPVIGTAICAGILVAIGFMLLVVPGLIVLTMLYVVIPVCVVEGLGPIRSLGRSRGLT